MKLTRFKLAFLSYALFDLLIGGHCGGLLPLGSMAAAQQGQAVGNITSAATTCSTTAVPTNCVILQLDGSTGAASIDISGTWAATLQIEAFGGVTWAAINCTPPNSTTAVSSTTANGVWQCNVAGFSSIRVRASAYTSGTAAVVINSAHASAKSGGGAVYASGLGTVNVIPKGNGAGQLADSSCTDNASTVACTEPIVVPDTAGSGVPSVKGATAATGLYLNGAIAGLVSTTNGWAAISGTAAAGLQIPSGGSFGLSSSGTIGGAGSDIGYSRFGAGVGVMSSGTIAGNTVTPATVKSLWAKLGVGGGTTPVALTGQTAAITTTAILTGGANTAGVYRVCYTANTTTSGTGTTATVSVLWNDGNAKTFTSSTFALNAVDVTGQVNGCQTVRAAASQNISYSVAGTFGTSAYSLYVSIEQLQ